MVSEHFVHMGPLAAAQRLDWVEAEHIDLEVSVKEMVSKAFEKAMDAVCHSLNQWQMESQTTAANQLGLSGPVGCISRGREYQEAPFKVKSEGSNPSQLSPLDISAPYVFDVSPERVKTPISISQVTKSFVVPEESCEKSLKLNPLQLTNYDRIMVHKIHENEYGKTSREVYKDGIDSDLFINTSNARFYSNFKYMKYVHQMYVELSVKIMLAEYVSC